MHQFRLVLTLGLKSHTLHCADGPSCMIKVEGNFRHDSKSNKCTMVDRPSCMTKVEGDFQHRNKSNKCINTIYDDEKCSNNAPHKPHLPLCLCVYMDLKIVCVCTSVQSCSLICIEYDPIQLYTWYTKANGVFTRFTFNQDIISYQNLDLNVSISLQILDLWLKFYIRIPNALISFSSSSPCFENLSHNNIPK